jgi:hypothetical protein
MKLFLTLLLFTCQAHAGTYFNVPNSTSDITTMTVSGKIGIAASSTTHNTNTILLNGVDGTIYSGNIGIGIAVPVNRLYVNSPYSDSTETVIKAVHRSAWNKTGAALELGSIASIVKIIAYNNPSNDSTSQLEIQTSDSGGIMRTGIYQNENGNVGISTNNPVAKLDVYGDTVFSNVNSTVTVSGTLDIGFIVKVYSGTTRYSHVACPSGYKAISGGCMSSSGPQWHSFPSTESTNGDGVGTPVSSNGTNAQSWTCATDAVGANTAFAICARIK